MAAERDEAPTATTQNQKPPGTTLAGYTPQHVWDYSLPQPGPAPYDFATGLPVFSNGTIIIPARAMVGSSSIIYCVDTQTKDVRWSRSFTNDGDLGTPIVAAGVIYIRVAGASNLYALDATTGAILWQKSYQLAADPLLVSGKLVFPTTDGDIVALDLQGNPLWSYSSGEPNTTRAVASAGIVMAAKGSTLHGIDLQTGNLKWKYTDPNAQSDSEISAGSGCVYFNMQSFDTNSDNLYAVDVATGNLSWKFSPITPVNLAYPSYYNGAVYTGDDGGRFSALNAQSGALLWQTSLQAGLAEVGFFFEDGIIYLAGFDSNGGAGSVFYAIDLASQGQDAVTLNSPVQYTIFGMQTGVTYSLDPATAVISAINLSGLVHQFFCESELMVEGYQAGAGGKGYVGRGTSFRTQVQLFDPNKNPRANKAVKVWASGPMTISSGGTSYDIDAASTGKSAWLQTDGSGELSIVSSASTITSPALYVWGNFMDLDEAIVIYPDHETLSKLSNVQGTDLQQATGYDGSEVLPSTYNAQQASALAKAVSNAIGGTAASLEQTRQKQQRAAPTKAGATRRSTLRGASNTYIAYPASSPNMLYQAVAGPSDRTYVPGQVASWTAQIDAQGAITFTEGPTAAALALPGSIWGDFDDFVDDVVDGVRSVASIAWSAVDNAVQTIYDDLGKGYQFIVTTIEQAAAVVIGVLKTIIKDIQLVIEWLSYLFEWEAILATKNTLKAAVTGGFNNLKTWVNNQVSSDLSNVHSFFQGIEGTVESTLGAAAAAVGGDTLQSQQQNGNNPQTVYGAGGARSYAKSRWAVQKFKDYAGQASVGSAVPGATSDPILTAIEGLITQIGSTIGNSAQFGSIPQDLKNVFSDFSLLATDPSEFVTKSFSDIITLIKDILVALVQLTDAIVEGVLQVLGALVDAVIGLLTQPIDIPVISELYSLITGGSTLTVLDLCCLLVAVPTTIVYKSLSSPGEPGGSLALGQGAVTVQQVGLVFSMAIYTVIDPLMDAADPPLPFKYGYMGLASLVQGLNFPSDLAGNTAGTYIFYAATAFPLIMTAVDIRYSSTGETEVWELLAPTIDVFYGIIMVGASFVLGMTYSQFRGTDYLSMIQNVISFTEYIFKPLALGDEDCKTALGLIDATCDLSATGLEATQIGL